MNVAAVVTTRNESATIEALVNELVMVVDDVIIIDEGSTDGTRHLAKDAGASLVRGASGGISVCQRYGWRLAMLRGADRIVQIDAGGSHDPGAIPTLLSHDVDVVIGSRFIFGASHRGPAWRTYGSMAYGDLWRLRTGVDVHDWTSGYRVFTRHAAEVLAKHDYRCRMHGWQAEAVAHAAADGLTIVESPIVYDPSDSSLSRKVAWEAVKGWALWKP